MYLQYHAHENEINIHPSKPRRGLIKGKLKNGEKVLLKDFFSLSLNKITFQENKCLMLEDINILTNRQIDKPSHLVM